MDTKAQEKSPRGNKQGLALSLAIWLFAIKRVGDTYLNDSAYFHDYQIPRRRKNRLWLGKEKLQHGAYTKYVSTGVLNLTTP